MPSHGKPVKFGKPHDPHAKKGYLGSTYHRGTVKMTPKQKKLFMVRKLAHTDVYRSEKGNVYRVRRFNK